MRLDIADAQYVVVVVHYVSFNMLGAATAALKPGGYLIFETMHAVEIGKHSLARKRLSEFLQL